MIFRQLFNPADSAMTYLVGDPASGEAVVIDPLKYQAPEDRPAAKEKKPAHASPEWLTVKLRYKLPKENKSAKIEVPFTGGDAAFENASEDFRFAAGVAAAGLMLRGDPSVMDLAYREVAEWTSAAVGADANGYRREFIDLLKNAAINRVLWTPESLTLVGWGDESHLAGDDRLLDEATA